MGVKEWSERLKEMIRTPQRDYPNDPKVTLQIDNYEEGGEPAEDAELDEMILDEGLRWATAQTEDNHILQVSKQSCQHPTRS